MSFNEKDINDEANRETTMARLGSVCLVGL